jgi:tRNA-2-methylthio-N6-dimethylallyladenosine synthase
MNVADSEVVASVMQMAGYGTTDDLECADAIFINTCSVRDNAEQRIFARLRTLNALRRKRANRLIIGIIGCMAERMKDELINNHGVDLVAGPDSYLDLPTLIAAAENGEKAINVELSTTETYRDIIPTRISANRISGFISIMRGCNNFCTYCIVPYTRGRERSRRPEDILEEVRCLAKNGCKEICLLGQNVNSYGIAKSVEGTYHYEKDKPYLLEDGSLNLDFAGLIREIDKIDGIERIRFMTSHPKDISDELIECFRDCRHLCKMIHLPVQSGSDTVLKRMNRHYDREWYLSKIDKLRKSCPDIALSTDIIVGFPGETEEDLEDTIDLVKKVRYDSAFTFIYSVRKDTPAEKYEDQIPEDVKHERFNRLLKAVHDIQEEKSAQYQDKVLKVLVEGPSKTNEDVLTGRTESNMTVDFPGGKELIGQIVDVRIVKAQTFSLYGELA